MSTYVIHQSFHYKWPLFPKISKLMTFNPIPNVIIITIKTPTQLSWSFQCPEQVRWTIYDAMSEIERILIENAFYQPLERNLIEIQSSLFAEPELIIEESEWFKAGYNYIRKTMRIDPKSGQDFTTYLKGTPTPGYVSLFVLSSNDGFDKIGYLLGYYYLDIDPKHTLKDFLDYYANNNPPGILYHSTFEQLKLLRPDEDITFIEPDGPWNMAPIEMTNQFPLILENPPNLGKPLDKNNDQAISIFKMIGDPSIVHAGFICPLHATPYPNTLLFSPRDESRVCDGNYYVTYSLRGSNAFLFALDNTSVYVLYGWKQVYKFNANVSCQLPLICIGIISDQKTDKPNIFLTDILKLGDQLFNEIYNFDNRLIKLYRDVFEKIKTEDIKIRFRAKTKMKNLNRFYQNLIDKCPDRYCPKNVDGVVFISHQFKPGKTLFLPIRPSIKFYWKSYGPTSAILYARNEEGDLYIPVQIYEFTNPKLYYATDKIIRFEIQNGSLEPVSVCKNESADFISYVKKILYSSQRPASVVIDRIKNNLCKVKIRESSDK